MFYLNFETDVFFYTRFLCVQNILSLISLKKTFLVKKIFGFNNILGH